jgi:hypothetical protein
MSSPKRTDAGSSPIGRITKEQLDSSASLESPFPEIGRITREQLDSLLEPLELEVYADLLSNEPRSEAAREKVRRRLREKFDGHLEDSVNRIWDLPSLVVQRPDEEYVRLLIEARDLFTMGYFYSCVAMCGIVGERLVKDLLRASLMVSKAGEVRRPSDSAFDQLERVDLSALSRSSGESGLLDADGVAASKQLLELRNQYAHARGRSAAIDALKSIRALHVLVDCTVSLYKDFHLVGGQLVSRGVA